MRIHRLIGPILALGACLTAGPPRPALAQSESALQLMKQALTQERAGVPPAAVVAYRKVWEQHPQDRLAPVAAYAAANLLASVLHDTTTAIPTYDRILNDYPVSELAAEAARRKAECLQGRKQWADAGAAYALALTYAGQGPAPQSGTWMNEVANGVADCYYRMGDRHRAVSVYQRVLEGPIAPQPAAAALYRLGDTYEALGDSADAAASFARVVEEYPFATVFEDAVARRALIDRYRKVDWAPYLTYARTTGDFARRDLAAVPARCDSVLAGSQSPALRACAEFRKIVAETQTSGDYTAGNLRLQALLDGLPDPRAMPNAATQLEQYQMLAAAEKRAASLPNDAAAQSALGGLYLQFGVAARAVGPLETALRLDPENAATHLLYGYACSAAGRPEDALAAFEFYIARNPNDSDVLNQVGYALLRLGQNDHAIGFFERLVALAPDDANAHDSLGEGYLNAGRLPDAAAQYEKALALDPSFTNSQFMLGEVYGRMGEKEKAIAAYQRYLTLSPDGGQAGEAHAALDRLGSK
jgi:tetratricopeptide (TPR) repeat protein